MRRTRTNKYGYPRKARVTAALPMLLPTMLLAAALTGCEREELAPAVADTVPPLPPAGLVVESARDGFVLIGWLRNTESDFGAYVVYRAEEAAPGNFIAVDTIARNYHIDGMRGYDTLYFYRVTAVDHSGNESEPSTTVSTRSPNRNAPETPGAFLAQGRNQEGETGVRLEWQQPEEFDLEGYEIHRSELPDFTPDASTLFAFTERALFDDTSTGPGSPRRYYAVVSRDRGGLTSVPSEALSDIVAELPAAVTPADGAQLTAAPEFAWHGVPGAVSYRISVSLAPSSEVIWNSAVPAEGNSLHKLSYKGPVLYRGRSYYWRISAFTRTDGRPNAVTRAFLFQII